MALLHHKIGFKSEAFAVRIGGIVHRFGGRNALPLGNFMGIAAFARPESAWGGAASEGGNVNVLTRHGVVVAIS